MIFLKPNFRLSLNEIFGFGATGRNKTGLESYYVQGSSSCAIMQHYVKKLRDKNYRHKSRSERVNEGILMALHSGHYIIPQTLVLDLQTVPEGKAPADVFRVLLQ